MRTRPIFHSSDAAIRGHVFCSFLALSCRNTWKTCHARPASCRNGRPCCATSIACSMCASAIAAMTGWCAPTSPSRSPIYSATPTSRCRRAPGRWRRRNSSHPQNPPGNAAVAPGVVPRHHEFRRKPRDLNRLQKSGVQVGSGSGGGCSRPQRPRSMLPDRLADSNREIIRLGDDDRSLLRELRNAARRGDARHRRHTRRGARQISSCRGSMPITMSAAVCPSAAAARTRTRPSRKHLAIHASKLAFESRVQILRRYHRSMLLRLERPRRSALENHVHRPA